MRRNSLYTTDVQSNLKVFIIMQRLSRNFVTAVTVINVGCASGILQQFVAAGDEVGEGLAFQQAVGEQCEVGDLACLFVAG